MTGITFAPLIPSSLLVLLSVVAFALVAYGLWHRAKGALVRAVPLLALLIALASPELVRENHTALKDVAVVIVDESDSQKLGERQARAAQAVEKLTTELGGVEDLEVRTIYAGRSDTAGGASGTHLFEALAGALSDVPAQRLAGSILISDGQVHDALSPERAEQVHAPYLNAPIHLLVTGERQEYDRRIRIESAPDFGLVGQDAKVRMRAEDTAAAEGTPIAVRITRNGGTPQMISLPAGTTTDVPLPMDNSGANVFEVEIAPAPNEISTVNNRTLVSINGIRDRLRVLLISGQPHVGERAWRNLLKSDPNVDLVHFTILRPLHKDDGTPMNELALIAFPMRELFEEQLTDFDLIIFDRYSQKGLVPFQYMANIASYVQQGGAVMLAVGPEYADSFSLFGSPLQNILPAEPTGRIFSGVFRPRLSELGQRHPVTAALEGSHGSTVQGGEPTWGRWLRQIHVIKAVGSPVLTGHEGEPLLILDRVGEGRVALLLSDTAWLWGKGFDGGGPQTELLRRVAHWLMKEPELEEESLSAEVKDAGLQVTRRSLAPEDVPVTVTLPDGTQQTVTPRADGNGAFTARLSITEPGVYTLTDGKKTALAAVGSPNPLESYDVVATADRVGPLAEKTGGGVYWLEDAVAPAVRRVVPGRVSHGSTWMGLKANEQFAVTGVTQTPLSPVALILLAIMAGAMLAWWREGK
jgi:hypothetical protein